MLKQTENIVKIEGILSEIDLAPKTFTKNGVQINAIGGVIKIRINQKINGAETELEVPVSMFSTEFTNAGGSNPAYESITRIMKDYISIAAGGIDNADRVRITKGQITMNEYYGSNGNLISFPRIVASFVTKISKEECKPEASFITSFVVASKGFETDKDGVETEKYKIIGLLPQYGGKIDVVPFYANNKGVIDAVAGYWNEGDTVKASGKLNFSSRIETSTVEVDFGEPIEQTRTISVNEFIITGGAATPLQGDFAIDSKDIETALAERKVRLADLKDKDKNKGTTGKAPTPTPGAGNKFKNLGF